ncbi:MAG: efflux RND transporter periplasmic adaptor subunit [Lentisphaeria bacterium]|nr:efflux RND transporter periplasmic adaptor subunit [Lentisphaeria bacterium]
MKLFARQYIKYWLIALVAVAVAVFATYRSYTKKKNQKLEQQKRATDAESDRTYKVKREDLPIGLIQGGTVNASHKHKLALQANFKTKLLWVVDENSWVKKGDVLLRFETDELKQKIEDYEIDLDNLKKELDIAIEDGKILESTNAADIQSAEDKLQQAEDAMRKYRRFERTRTINTHENNIANAESALKTAESAYTELRDSELGSDDENKSADEKRREELESKQETIDSKSIALENVEGDYRAWRRYDHPTKIKRLRNDLEQAHLNLRKVRISVNSKVIQKRRSIEYYRRRIRMTQTQLDRHREYMDMMVIKAPVEGVVIYSDPDRRWGRLDVKVGMDVGKGQILVTIPEMSNLIVDFDLPEEYRSKVNVGDVAVISPDSLVGTKFTGKIMSIATLPVNMVSWDSASPKVYKAKIQFDKQSPLLVNGMSVQLNIVTKVIKNTLFVPVEAVFEDNDRFYVYKHTLTGVEEQDVKIGESNDNFVQITEGIDEGDIVYLYRPYQKKQENK